MLKDDREDRMLGEKEGYLKRVKVRYSSLFLLLYREQVQRDSNHGTNRCESRDFHEVECRRRGGRFVSLSRFLVVTVWLRGKAKLLTI